MTQSEIRPTEFGNLTNPMNVFLSYNNLDREAAEYIARHLRNAGVDLNYAPLQPAGTEWTSGLEKQLQDCDALVVLIGPHGLGQWQKIESNFALCRSTEENLPIVPVLLPRSECPEGFLKLRTWIDLRRDIGDTGELTRLANAVNSIHEPTRSQAGWPQAPSQTRKHKRSHVAAFAVIIICLGGVTTSLLVNLTAIPEPPKTEEGTENTRKLAKAMLNPEEPHSNDETPTGSKPDKENPLEPSRSQDPSQNHDCGPDLIQLADGAYCTLQVPKAVVSVTFSELYGKPRPSITITPTHGKTVTEGIVGPGEIQFSADGRHWTLAIQPVDPRNLEIRALVKPKNQQTRNPYEPFK